MKPWDNRFVCLQDRKINPSKGFIIEKKSKSSASVKCVAEPSFRATYNAFLAQM